MFFIRDGAFVAVPVGTAVDVALVVTVGCDMVDAAKGEGAEVEFNGGAIALEGAVVGLSVGPGVIKALVGLLVAEVEGPVVLDAAGPVGLAVLGLSTGLSVRLAAVEAFPVGLLVMASEGADVATAVVGKMDVMTAGPNVEFTVGAEVMDIIVAFWADGTGVANINGLGATVGAFVVESLVGTCVTAPAVSCRVGADVSAATDGERVSVENEGAGVSAG
jgi:hypothetical protein